MSGPYTQGQRHVAAFALFALALLSMSCEMKKAAPPPYLLIVKRATTIKDTLDVTEKLSDVRGRIEQMQGEMKFLTAQIDMSSLEISLRAESDAAVAGIHWRPLRQVKIAVGEMLSGLADWADSVIAFLINLPLIGVWLLSVVILVLVRGSHFASSVAKVRTEDELANTMAAFHSPR
jgi:hypothetical protein